LNGARQRFRLLSAVVERSLRKWWNWQTHHLEGVAPKGMRVQVPPSAPLSLTQGNAMILVYILHVLVSLFLILVVLIQSGKGGDLSMFTSGGSQTAFGPAAGATLFTKLTTWSAIIFMVTSITLSIHSSRNSTGSSILSGQSSSQPAKK
jgi:preprotein translocase subunit SecG